jgi:hypothetical protein
MNLNIFKKILISLSAVVFSLMLTTSFASALPYTGTSTEASPIPAFDVFTATTGNPIPAPAPSDSEANFLEARVPINGDGATDSTTPFSESSLTTACTNGEVIQFRVYVHNGANAADNDNGTGPSIAHNTQVQVTIPGSQSTTFVPEATISSSNAASVSDTYTVDCTSSQPVELQYIAGSAAQYSVATNAITALPDTIVTTGSLIQSDTVPGDVWACWAQRVLVELSVKVVVPTTPPVTPPTTPPTTPPVLVNTGPGSYLGAVAGIASIAGLGYFLRGRYLVRK